MYKNTRDTVRQYKSAETEKTPNLKSEVLANGSSQLIPDVTASPIDAAFSLLIPKNENVAVNAEPIYVAIVDIS